MNPFTADPRSANFTFFFQSLHSADKSAWTQVDDNASSTAPSQTFVMNVVARRAVAQARSRR